MPLPPFVMPGVRCYGSSVHIPARVRRLNHLKNRLLFQLIEKRPRFNNGSQLGTEFGCPTMSPTTSRERHFPCNFSAFSSPYELTLDTKSICRPA